MLGCNLPKQIADDIANNEFDVMRHIYTNGAAVDEDQHTETEGVNNSDAPEIVLRYDKKRHDLQAWLQDADFGPLWTRWGYADADGGCEAAVQESLSAD